MDLFNQAGCAIFFCGAGVCMIVAGFRMLGAGAGLVWTMLTK